MFDIITGITDTSVINYCPRCGAEIRNFYGDGTAKCNECSLRFGVVECEDD